MLTDMTPPKEQRKCTNPVARVFVRSSARRSGWFDFFRMHGRQCRHVSLIGGELASHHPVEAIEVALSRFGLRQHVSAVVAESGSAGNPDAQLFDVVQRRIPGVRRERSLEVGDTEADLRFAQSASLRSCWAVYGFGHHARCMAVGHDHVGHDHVLDQLECLPRILRDWSA